MCKNILISVFDDKISLNFLDFLYSNDIGAIVSFAGVVRNVNNNRNVSYISYNVFDSLMYSLIKDKCISLIKDDVCTKICIAQYKGVLYTGGINLLIGVGSKHRKKALLYCNDLVEFIKKEAPVWKKEYYSDGTFNWINS